MVVKADEPLYSQVEQWLRREICSGRLSVGSRLPSEQQLATRLHVSRTTIRRALMRLRRDHLVIRRQALGSFVNTTTDSVAAGIETLEEFDDTVMSVGLTPANRLLEVSETELPEAVCDALGEPRPTRGYRVTAVKYLNSVPLFYSEVCIAARLVSDPAVLHRRESFPSTRSMIEGGLGHRVEYAALDILSAAARPPIDRHLGVDELTPLVLLSGVSFSSAGQPVFHSVVYIRTDRYHFTVVRRC